MTGCGNVIPTEKPIGFDEESTVCSSQSGEPEVPTRDPHVIRLRSFLRMTGLTDCHSLNPVIPTEKPIGFDEESTVCSSQTSRIRGINCGSSRRSFYSLLRMTGLRDCYFEIYITIPLRMTGLADCLFPKQKSPC